MTEKPDSDPELEGMENPEGFTGPMLHMGIAEQGKLHAVDGDHKLALQYYRRAMHMAVSAEDSEFFFRHYLECVMESLEHLGSFEDVLIYCEKALELYAKKPPEDPVSVRDLAHVHQRKAVALIKSGDVEAAAEPLREAVRLVREADQTIPLAEALLRWVDAGYRIDPARVLAEQKRHGYFSVRRDTVDASRAVKLPPEMLAVGTF